MCLHGHTMRSRLLLQLHAHSQNNFRVLSDGFLVLDDESRVLDDGFRVLGGYSMTNFEYPPTASGCLVTCSASDWFTSSTSITP